MSEKVYGLLGKSLPHSFSPKIHSYLGDYNYSLFEFESDGADEFFKNREFDGINVTIPYKIKAYEKCDVLSNIAKRIGAVNTVCNRGGILGGFNTDYFGFLYLVKKSGINVEGKKAIILGSGGASLTVRTVLEDLHAKSITVISRSGEDNYENIEKHFDAEIIVNTTPVGMYPASGISPIELKSFTRCKGVIDVIYNPHLTALLLEAEALGIPHIGGLAMLVAQAKEASELFTGNIIPDEIIDKITADIEFSTKNIILIGMPGCGKTTIGKAVAEKLDRPFYDMDEEIIKKEGRSIPEIFSDEGEAGFRKIEAEVCAELSKMSGAVIATGGGCVVTKENHRWLHSNGTVVWIKRDINKLPTKGRPISKSKNLHELYRQRRPLYEALADYTVETTGNIVASADKIIKLLKP